MSARNPRRPLRRRISTSIVGVAAVAVVLFAVPLGFTISQAYRGQAITELQRDATRIAVTVPDSFGVDTSPLTLPADLPDNLTVGVYNTDGGRVAANGPRHSALAASGADGHLHTVVDSGELAVCAPVPSDGAVALTVRVARPYAEVRNRILRAWALMALLAALIISIATTLAYRQARQISVPLEALTADARALGDGDFTIHPSPSGMDEADALGAALQATARRLGELVERERKFSADVSHQLRTPLTAMLLGLEAALARPGADLHESTRQAIARAEQLHRTIEDLLTLARDTHDGPPLNIDELLDDLRERWHARFATAARRLTLTHDAYTPPVAANPRAVRQILDVLLDNALVHGRGHTRVTVTDSGGGVSFDVSDDGAGIDGDPESVFTRRTEPTDHGIGLALASSLAEATGGRLFLRQAAPSPVFSLLLPPTDHPDGASKR